VLPDLHDWQSLREQLHLAAVCLPSAAGMRLRRLVDSRTFVGRTEPCPTSSPFVPARFTGSGNGPTLPCHAARPAFTRSGGASGSRTWDGGVARAARNAEEGDRALRASRVARGLGYLLRPGRRPGRKGRGGQMAGPPGSERAPAPGPGEREEGRGSRSSLAPESGPRNSRNPEAPPVFTTVGLWCFWTPKKGGVS